MKQRKPVDEGDMMRVAETVLQAIAMALCALILLNMNIESHMGIPTHVCIEAPQSPPE